MTLAMATLVVMEIIPI
ncbi:UNVERIFIED_CONTAM: hypothetical protein GTU68_005703 [Idotea baltica]|nr:hypothetical protein [Idotea baltica]